MKRQRLTADTAQKQRSECGTKNVYLENYLQECDNGTHIRGWAQKDGINSKYKVKKKTNINHGVYPYLEQLEKIEMKGRKNKKILKNEKDQKACWTSCAFNFFAIQQHNQF